MIMESAEIDYEATCNDRPDNSRDAQPPKVPSFDGGCSLWLYFKNRPTPKPADVVDTIIINT